jgi:hypothetical protein
VTCSQATPGTVTSPTGSVKGISAAGLTDVYTGNYGGSALSDPAAVAARGVAVRQHRGLPREGCGNGYAANEVTLRFTLVGYWNTNGQLPPVQPPTGDLPLTFQADGTWLTTGDGVNRQLKAYFMKARSNGGAGTDTVATSGTVTFTTMSSGTYDGSYDVYFGTDHVTGSLTSPWCA